MATGFFYKTSADGGAPTLNNSAGSLITVLDWILDTAGGTHWEKVFTGTNKAVYRATAGERYYLRVDDSIGQVARFVAYETMSDVDTGTNPFPGTGTSFGYLAIPKSNNAAASPYWAVGDSRYFMFWASYDDTYPWLKQMMAFGEATPFDSADSYSTVVIGSNYNSTSAAWNQWISYGWITNGYTFSNLPLINGSNASLFVCNTPDGLSPGVGGNWFESYIAIESSNFPYADQGAISIQPNTYLNFNGMSTSDTTLKHYRGRVPYWYSSPLQIEGGGLVGGDTIEDGTDVFLAVARGTTSSLNNANTKLTLIRISDNEPGRA